MNRPAFDDRVKAISATKPADYIKGDRTLEDYLGSILAYLEAPESGSFRISETSAYKAARKLQMAIESRDGHLAPADVQKVRHYLTVAYGNIYSYALTHFSGEIPLRQAKTNIQSAIEAIRESVEG